MKTSGEHTGLTSDFAWPASAMEPAFWERWEQSVLPAYFQKCRWFAGKARRLRQLKVQEQLLFQHANCMAILLLVEAVYVTGKQETYFLPIAMTTAAPEMPEKSVIEKLPAGQLIDAVYDASFRQALWEAFEAGLQLPLGDFVLSFDTGQAFLAGTSSSHQTRILSADQSNTALFFGEQYFFKFYRKLFQHTNPELEVVRFLSEKGHFRQIPSYAGGLSLRKGDDWEMTLGMLQSKVRASGDAWSQFQAHLNDFLQSERVAKFRQLPVDFRFLELDKLHENALLAKDWLEPLAFHAAQLLGKRTAEMHNALAVKTADPAFEAVSFDRAYQDWLAEHVAALLQKRQQMLVDVLPRLEQEAHQLAKNFEQQLPLIRTYFDRIGAWQPQSLRIRIHGDYHLGQVLQQDHDYIILDFEGEPESSIDDRKVKHSPLKDVAGMLRSFHYAAYAALYFGGAVPAVEARAEAEQLAENWFQLIAVSYLEAYLAQLHLSPFGLLNKKEVTALLQWHLLEKAVYEFGYELNGRPDWVIIPLKGIHQILDDYQNQQPW